MDSHSAHPASRPFAPQQVDCARRRQQERCAATSRPAGSSSSDLKVNRIRPRRVIAGGSIAVLLAAMSAAPGFVGNAQAAAVASSISYSANVSDTMQRTVAAGFGQAEMGGRYTVTSASQFSVGSGVGHIAAILHGTSTGAALSNVVAANEVLRLDFTMPRLPILGNGSFVSVQLRRQVNGDAYLARVRVAPHGLLRVSLAKIQNNTTSYFGGAEVAVPSSARAGAMIALQAQVTGSAPARLAVRAWTQGSTMPGWLYTGADSSPGDLAGTGGTGVNIYQSAGSQTADVDVHRLLGWQIVPATPTPTPPPTPTPTPSKGAGAAALGTARYAIPSGAVFVSPSGSDSSGTGSLQAPFATVGRGVSAAASGGTVVLRAGSYHQYLFIGKTVTIQNYPGEVAWMDGSVPVSGWTKSGSAWVHAGWGYQFDHSASFDCGSNAGGFVNSAYPLAAYPDQVFLDGRQLVQVSSGPVAGQFAVNYSTGTITTGSDPTGHQVRASNLQQAFVVGGSGVTIRGIGVRNYATSLCQMGTIYLGGSIGGDTLQNLVLTDNATQALSIDTARVVADHLSVQNNGMTGIHADGANGSSISNSLITGNNTQRFNNAPATAGIKIGRLDGFTIRNNVLAGNTGGNGIWTDENVTNFVIVGNTVTNSGGEYGIINELSDTGIVANNTISAAQEGYTAFDSGNVQVFNNTFRNNSVWDLGLSQDNRYLPGMSTAGVNPTTADPWVVKNVVADNNDLCASTAMFEYYVLDKQTNRTADSMHLTVNGNLFLNRPGSSGAWPIGWGAGNNSTVATYPTPEAFDTAKNTTWVNKGIMPAALTPNTVDYSYAVPLPANIAQAVGVATGTQHVGTF